MPASPAVLEQTALSVASHRRIKRWITQTPCIPSRLRFDDGTGLVFKAENFQQTGSFKFRGAMSKLTSLSTDVPAITASWVRGQRKPGRLRRRVSRIFCGFQRKRGKSRRRQQAGQIDANNFSRPHGYFDAPFKEQIFHIATRRRKSAIEDHTKPGYFTD
jgi:hypothetical protein